MHDLNLIDRDLYLDVRRRQEELWDALIGALADALTGVSDTDWSAGLGLTADDLHEDLHFGRS